MEGEQAHPINGYAIFTITPQKFRIKHLISLLNTRVNKVTEEPRHKSRILKVLVCRALLYGALSAPLCTNSEGRHKCGVFSLHSKSVHKDLRDVWGQLRLSLSPYCLSLLQGEQTTQLAYRLLARWLVEKWFGNTFYHTHTGWNFLLPQSIIKRQIIKESLKVLCIFLKDSKA